jgi:hypothetical protein
MDSREAFEKWAASKMKNFAGWIDLSLVSPSGHNEWTYATKAAESSWRAWQASRQALEGESRPSIGQRKAAQIGPFIGVLAQNQDGRVCAVTDMGRCTWLSEDVTECPYPCGWCDLQSIAINKAAFIARSAEDDIGTPFEDIRQAGAELGRIAIKLCSLAIKQEQKS